MTQNGNVGDSAEIAMEKGKILNDKEIDTAKLFNFDAYSLALKNIISSESTDTPLTIGIFGDWGTGKTSLMKSIKKKLEEDETRLFSWDDVPGEDDGEFRKYLKDKYQIGWVEKPKFHKSKDGITIRIDKDENSAKITIDEKAGKATLKIRDVGRSDGFIKLYLTLYVNLIISWLKGKLRQYQEASYNPPYDLTAKTEYLFNWDDIPGNDDEKKKLIKYLKDDLGIAWVENADISKPDNKTIQIVKGGISAKITSDEEAGQATVQVSGDRTYKLRVEKKYQFSWNDILRNDEKLKGYFRDVFGIGWVESAEISKSEDGKTIRIVKGENSAEITIDEEKGKVILQVNDNETRDIPYLFNWDDILGNDDEKKKLRKYLKKDIKISWAENAKITKPDGKTIKIDKGDNSAKITIDEEAGKATLQVSGGGTHNLIVKKKYLFRWDDIPRNDNEKIRECLVNVLGIDWVKDAEIPKPDGETIHIVKGENSAEITIGEPTIKTSTGRTHNLTVETEDGKLKIYKKKIVRLNICDTLPEEDALKVKCIWFNAWKQSFGQRNLSTTPSLLYHIHKEFGGETTNSEKIKEWGRILGEIAADGMLRKFAGGMTVDEVKDRFKTTTASRAKLSTKFQGAVDDYLGATGYERVVVFIDDLDRCLPENVLNVLETIKLFLGTEKCIFVLGVDMGVIAKSIDVRYKDFAMKSDGGKSLISGDRYLEKIIQLIFQLPPIRPGDIERFIAELDLPKFYEPYIGMISSIEQNPRKVKRLLNNLELQRTLASRIKDIKTIMEDDTKRSLYEALLIEWAIIDSYYPPPIRNGLLKEPILLAEMHEYVKRGNELLFSWKDIPDDDEENKKLKAYLMEDHDIDWVENAQISKHDDKTIRLVKDKNSAEITIEIDDDTKKATIYSGYDKIHDLEVSDENGKLNIYVGVPVELKNFMKESEVWIENLKKLIRAFPSEIKKLPKVGDVDHVIYLSQATESQAPKPPAEEIQPPEPTAEKTKPKKVLTRNAVLEYIDNKKDLTGTDMSNLTLKGIDFSDVDNMREVNMSGAYLSGVTLDKVDLSDANLSGADLIGAKLAGANLRNVNLSKAKLREANLSDANLSEADLSGANLSGADLSGADLSGAKLAGANLRDANLSKAKLRQVADWSGADLSGADLRDAKLAGANLRDVNLSKAKLRQADLSGANLSGADLSDANLEKANLRRAQMDSCILKGAHLRHCNIWYASLVNADLHGADVGDAEFFRANLQGTIFENAKLKNTSLNSANLSGAKFKEAEFSSSNLAGSTLKEADFRGANLDTTTIMQYLKKASLEGAMFDDWVMKELEKGS